MSPSSLVMLLVVVGCAVGMDRYRPRYRDYTPRYRYHLSPNYNYHPAYRGYNKYDRYDRYNSYDRHDSYDRYSTRKRYFGSGNDNGNCDGNCEDNNSGNGNGNKNYHSVDNGNYNGNCQGNCFGNENGNSNGNRNKKVSGNGNNNGNCVGNCFHNKRGNGNGNDNSKKGGQGNNNGNCRGNCFHLTDGNGQGNNDGYGGHYRIDHRRGHNCVGNCIAMAPRLKFDLHSKPRDYKSGNLKCTDHGGSVHYLYPNTNCNVIYKYGSNGGLRQYSCGSGSTFDLSLCACNNWYFVDYKKTCKSGIKRDD